MKKILTSALLAVFLVFSLSSCGKDAEKQEAGKDLPYYKNLWKDTFRSYQSAVTNMPKKGKFDFELSVMASGSGEALS